MKGNKETQRGVYSLLSLTGKESAHLLYYIQVFSCNDDEDQGKLGYSIFAKLNSFGNMLS